MKVTTKDVEYIAQLSRLTIPEGEMEKFTEQFNQILIMPISCKSLIPKASSRLRMFCLSAMRSVRT